MSITALSDRSLLCIFEQMWLQDLLNIELICRRWKSLLPQVCAKRGTVTLLVGPGAKNMTLDSRFALPRGDHIPPHAVMFGAKRFSKWSHLALDTLDEDIVDQLSNLFVKVTNLEIVQCQLPPSTADHVIALLTKWSDHLVLLKLDCSYIDYGSFQTETISQQLFRLVNCINSLPKLQYLAFESDNWFHTSSTDIRTINLTILARLKEFYFFSKDRACLMLSTLQRYGKPNKELRRIGLASAMTRRSMASFGPRVEAEFAARFCQFTFKEPLSKLSDWRLLTTRFSSLNKLWIPLGVKPSWAHVSTCLAQLKQLVCLRLEINFVRAPPKTAPSGTSPAQLPSVRILGLFITPKSHQDLACMPLAPSFPVTQTIDIAITGRPQCTICQAGQAHFEPEQCHRLLLRTLKKFPQLQMLSVLNPEPRQVSLEDL